MKSSFKRLVKVKLLCCQTLANKTFGAFAVLLFCGENGLQLHIKDERNVIYFDSWQN